MQGLEFFPSLKYIRCGRLISEPMSPLAVEDRPKMDVQLVSSRGTCPQNLATLFMDDNTLLPCKCLVTPPLPTLTEDAGTSKRKHGVRLLSNSSSSDADFGNAVPKRQKKQGRNMRSRGCGLCFKNRECRSFYTSHQLKDDDGKVTCPVLAKFVCPICNVTGQHTEAYCPEARKDKANGEANKIFYGKRNARGVPGVTYQYL